MKRYLIAFALAGCGDAPGEAPPPPDGAPPEVTYYRDIAPMTDAICARCHVAGGIGPFPLTTYEEVAAQADVALLNLEQGVMPPWPPADGCDDYVGDRSLSDEQIATFARWVELGAPAGSPDDRGAAWEIEETALSRVDLTIEMPDRYTPSLAPDDYRCFPIPWPESRRRYVTGFRARPGDPATVHHVIAFLARPDQAAAYGELDAAEPGPGYTCFGGSGGPSREWIGGWAPGSQGSDAPVGVGIPIEPGSLIVLQVHYNLGHGVPGPDRTALDVKLDDAVDHDARVLPFTNPQWVFGDEMVIAAGDQDATYTFEADPTLFNGGRPFRIHGAALHMHTLGTRASLTVARTGGDDCALAIDRWNFHWQGTYSLTEPKQIDPGDQVRLECHWDNSAANQPIIDGIPQPPREVRWGEGTADEMCLGVFYISQL
jgi:hypothetical protein